MRVPRPFYKHQSVMIVDLQDWRSAVHMFAEGPCGQLYLAEFLYVRRKNGWCRVNQLGSIAGTISNNVPIVLSPACRNEECELIAIEAKQQISRMGYPVTIRKGLDANGCQTATTMPAKKKAPAKRKAKK